jgi:hypothetical protein
MPIRADGVAGGLPDRAGDRAIFDRPPVDEEKLISPRRERHRAAGREAVQPEASGLRLALDELSQGLAPDHLEDPRRAVHRRRGVEDLRSFERTKNATDRRASAAFVTASAAARSPPPARRGTCGAPVCARRAPPRGRPSRAGGRRVLEGVPPYSILGRTASGEAPSDVVELEAADRRHRRSASPRKPKLATETEIPRSEEIFDVAWRSAASRACHSADMPLPSSRTRIRAIPRPQSRLRCATRRRRARSPPAP